MSTDGPRREEQNGSVVQWLLDADPSIRWQVLRDLTDAPAHDVAAERARVATEGWGARLLALQGRVRPDDGREPTGRAWITLRALRVLDWYTAGR